MLKLGYQYRNIHLYNVQQSGFYLVVSITFTAFPTVVEIQSKTIAYNQLFAL